MEDFGPSALAVPTPQISTRPRLQELTMSFLQLGSSNETLHVLPALIRGIGHSIELFSLAGNNFDDAVANAIAPALATCSRLETITVQGGGKKGIKNEFSMEAHTKLLQAAMMSTRLQVFDGETLSEEDRQSLGISNE